MENKNKEIIAPNRKRALEIYNKNSSKFEELIQKIYIELKEILSKNNINFVIKYRVKSFNSYYEKLIGLINSDEYKPITDMFALRIICPFLEDVDIVSEIISSNFDIIEKEQKGAGYTFKEFGYESIHFLIPVPEFDKFTKMPKSEMVYEIQLRTILQDAWAEVEHELIYKFHLSKYNSSIKRKMASLNASLTLSDIIFQEIRDYNKELSLKEKKRRDSILKKIDLTDNFNIEHLDETKSKENEFKKLGQIEEDVVKMPIKMKYADELEELLVQGLTAHSNNEIEKAIDIYSVILKKKPEMSIRSIIYNHRGMAYFLKSKYLPAIKDFSRAIDYDSSNYRAFNNRGKAYRYLKEYELALKDFNHSLSRNANQKEGLYNRSLTYYDLHDFSKSLEDCEKTLLLDENFEAAQNLKKIILGKMF